MFYYLHKVSKNKNDTFLRFPSIISTLLELNNFSMTDDFSLRCQRAKLKFFFKEMYFIE